MVINTPLLDITATLSVFLQRGAHAFDGSLGQNEAIASTAVQICIDYPTHGVSYFPDTILVVCIIIFDISLEVGRNLRNCVELRFGFLYLVVEASESVFVLSSDVHFYSSRCLYTPEHLLSQNLKRLFFIIA
jgi:hypothetical protein